MKRRPGTAGNPGRAGGRGARGPVAAIAAIAVGVFALVLAPRLHAGDEPVRSRLPLVSEGEIDFFVDLSGYRSDTPETEEEFYVSVSNDQLRFDVEGEAAERVWIGELKLEIRVRDPEGGEAFRIETKLVPQAGSELDATDRGILQIIREKASLAPGLYHLEVVLTDELALKPGLISRIRKAKNRGRAFGWIEVPRFDTPALLLSDLTLLRKARAAAPGSAFGRNGVDFDPNPSRYYGLALHQVRSYLEVYDGAFEEMDSFLVETTIQDRTSAERAKKVSRATPRTGAFVVTDVLELDPKGFPAGSYVLQIVVSNERTRETVRASRPFEVIWAVTSWHQDRESLLQEMRLVMSESEFRTLEGLQPGAREVFLAEFWRSLDPVPESPENEALIEFKYRVRYADQAYSATLQRGILTDRGRVFVRYGPPDDVDYQYSSSSFGNDEADQRVADPSERVTLGGRPSASFLDADEFREGDVSDVAAQRGGTNIRSKQLVIWRYDGRGRVLSGKVDLDSRSHRGLKFVFADEIGDGNYELIGSTGASLY